MYEEPVQKAKLSVASLFEVAAQFRHSHGLEFAKGIIRQLGGDEVAVTLFEEISTSRQKVRGKIKL